MKRRSPKKLGWSRGMFDGPGGLADRNAHLESFLALEVEGPAAAAFRGFAVQAASSSATVPPALGRYLAWAAARSLPMLALYEAWINDLPPAEESQYAEPPPKGFGEWVEISRVYRMEHPQLGVRNRISPEEVEALRNEGWRLLLDRDGFLQLVHLQAWYFQVRFFPRLKWLRLRTPTDKYFEIGDRPIVWGFAGDSDCKPSALRHPDVQLAAPLTHSLALFAYHPLADHPEVITPEDINKIVASAAHEWIAGPTECIVREALMERTYH